MTKPAPAKLRINEKARVYSSGKLGSIDSKKFENLLKAVAKDEEHWLWVNAMTGDDFTWASELMAGYLSKEEVAAVRKHLETHELLGVTFDDTKAYGYIIQEAIENEISRINKSIELLKKKLEEATATVLSFKLDGTMTASGYTHGIPLVCYMEPGRSAFVVYMDDEGRNAVYGRSDDIPLPPTSYIVRSAKAVEDHADSYEKAERLHAVAEALTLRLSNLKKYGTTVV